MESELLILAVMVAVFAGGCFGLKLPVALGLAAASVAGALVAGMGVPIRHLVEGMFSFFDFLIIIATAMIYMKVLQHTGVMDTLGRQVTEAFYRKPSLLLMVLMLLILFPGAITGSSTACVFTTGALVAPVMMNLGIPRVQTAAIIAIGSLLGMIAPPVCLPAMIIGEGLDMPYVGFFWPLTLLTVPLAMFFVLAMGRRYVRRDIDIAELSASMPPSLFADYGWKLYLPLGVLFALMVAPKAAPQYIYDPGLSFAFVISTAVGLFTGRKIRFLQTAKAAMKEAIPIMGILMGVGMFIQVMTLTGARGAFVVTSLTLPKAWLLVAVATAIPAFGAVSAIGSASVLGVPIALALLGNDQILAVSALALVASLGDLVPPTALAGLFAAQILQIENYFTVLRRCLWPALVIDLVGVAALAYVNWIGKLL